MHSSLKGIAPGIALLLLVAVAPTASGQVLQGNLDGEVDFEQVSAAVAARLAANPVVPGAGAPLACFVPGELLAAVTAPYTAENAAIGGDGYRLASFHVNPVVEPAGSSFLVALDRVAFADGATYRHGTRQQMSTFANGCGPVFPAADDADDADGTNCTVGECAALLQVRVELAGAPEDLGVLTDPAGCTVDVLAEDVAGSGTFSPQAASAPVPVPWVVLSTVGVEIPVLARADAALQVRVGCLATVLAGEDGFTIDPATQMAVLTVDAPVATTAACGAQVPVDVIVPVDRPAGSITGMFDVAGYDEVSAEVLAADTPYATAPPLFGAGDSPVRGESSSYWTLEDLPEGAYEIVGTAIVDGGDTLVRFPMTTGANGAATVVAGATTDLDAWFVAAPQPLEGHVTLMDLGATALDELQLEPLTTLHTGWNNNSRTSRADARGDSAVVPGGGASGEGAYSKGRLKGAYDPVTGKGEFDYRMLLSGPSAEGASEAGTDALPVAWDFRRFLLRLGNGAAQNVQRVAVHPGLDLHYVTQAGGPTHSVPSQTLCFGQVEVEYRVDPQNGAIWYPELELDGEIGAGVDTAVPGANYGVVAQARGLPSASSGASQARAYSTVPEGIAYEATPFINFTAAGGGGTQRLQLDAMILPGAGVLGCGDVTSACAFIDGGTGSATPLAVSLDPGLPFCTNSGQALSVGIDVDSGGAWVDVVTVAVDGAAPALVCEGCGADPQLQYDFPDDFGPGQHQVVIEAGSVNGCTAHLVETFTVSDEPCVDPGVSERQLAYVDGDGVRVVRLEDDQMHWALPALGSPRQLTYDASGELLAIVRDGGVLVVDADAPADSTVYPGAFEAVAFRPTDNRDLASVEAQPGVSANGPYRVTVRLQEANATVHTPDFVMPQEWSITAPRIAWSADGTRLLTAYSATFLGTPTERRLRIAEWIVAPEGLTPAYPPLDWETSDAPGIRTLHEVGLLGDSTRLLLTNAGLFRYSLEDISLVQAVDQGMPVAAFPNPMAGAAAFASGAGVGLAGDVGVVVEPQPPTGAKATDIALSVAMRLMAVAYSDGRIVLHRIDASGGAVTLPQDRTLTTQQPPRAVAFRPLGQ